MAPSVPARGFASMESSDRTYSSTLPLSSRAVNAIRVPSGERTGGPVLPPCKTNEVPGGGRIEDRTTATGRFARLKYAAVATAAARTATTAMVHGNTRRQTDTCAARFGDEAGRDVRCAADQLIEHAPSLAYVAEAHFRIAL